MAAAVLGIAAMLAAAGVVLAFMDNNSRPSRADDIKAAGGDITIVKSDVTEEAAFHPYKAGEISMEVIAVRASDGTVRTALNTCQVCYNSDRGYYKQDGDVLVCQNCGNRFTVDQVEVVKGGCNPVPIVYEEKTDDGETITISAEVLSEYAPLFTRWKR